MFRRSFLATVIAAPFVGLFKLKVHQPEYIRRLTPQELERVHQDIEHNARIIRAAHRRAQAFNRKFPHQSVPATWRDFVVKPRGPLQQLIPMHSPANPFCSGRTATGPAPGRARRPETPN